MLEAFASLVVNAYENGEPIAPECVMRDSKEWTDFDDVKNRLLGLFESTGDERDTMTPKAIHQVSHMNGVDMNAHNSFVITLERSGGTVLQTHTLADGETSFTFNQMDTSYGT